MVIAMADEPTISRRERLRAETLAEIKQHALTQIAQAGVEALSLNAVARAIGMSGPALYRYYASRDDLLETLVADAWNDLADSLEATARGARRRGAEARFRAVCGAYRAWALEQPHRYRLALETDYGSGRFSPQATLPGANRAMAVLLDAVADLKPRADSRPGAIHDLDKQLDQWAHARSLRSDLSPQTLEMGVLTWTRLHGTVSLELAGVFESMALDPALLHQAEVDLLLTHHATLRDPAGPHRASKAND
jgi:AcrR family transcriptional regulator